MITRYSVWLNGQGLQDVDGSILITDVQESAPRLNASTGGNARYPGLRLTRHLRQTLSVTVRFQIREYDTARRKRILDAVAAWAGEGGWLTTSDRLGQALQVVCTDAPSAPSALKWTQELTVAFTAYALPYWQDEHPTALTLNLQAGVPALAELYPTGNAPLCFLTFEAENRGSAPITSLSLSVGASAFRLTHPALIPAGGVLTLGYDQHHLLTLRQGDVSMLAARSADSSDDLVLLPGRRNELTVQANQPLQLRLKVRGLYL